MNRAGHSDKRTGRRGLGERLKGGDIPESLFYPENQNTHDCLSHKSYVHDLHVYVFDNVFGICSFNASTLHIGSIFLFIISLRRLSIY